MARPLPPNARFRIIPQHDGKVCEICRQAAHGGPYTLRQVKNRQQTYDKPGFLHPNCRCTLEVIMPKPESIGAMGRKRSARDILSRFEAMERAEKKVRSKKLSTMRRRQSVRD